MNNDPLYTSVVDTLQTLFGTEIPDETSKITYLILRKKIHNTQSNEEYKSFPVDLAFSFLTGKPPEEYWTLSTNKKLMATIFDRGLYPGIDAGIFTPESNQWWWNENGSGRAREVDLSDDMMVALTDSIINKIFKEPVTNYKNQNETVRGRGWSKDYSRHHDVTRTVFDSYRKSTFLFDHTAILNNREYILNDVIGYNLNNKNSLSRALALISNLNTIEHMTPQGHGRIHLAASGRMSPSKGLLYLPEQIRVLGLRARPGNCLIKADLSSAQLVLNSTILGAKELHAVIEQIFSENKTFWEYAGLTAESKTAYKMATYCVCFGASERNIVDMVNKSCGEGSFTDQDLKKLKEDTKDLFKCREEWFKKHKPQEIAGLVGTKNKLGLKFVTKNESHPVASYLAWLNQSEEQWIMQETIASLVTNFPDVNIALYAHDGVYLEIPQQQKETVKNFLQEHLNKNYSPHKYKFDDFICDAL